MVAAYVPGDVAANVQDAVDVPPAERVALEEHDAMRSGGVDTLRVTGPASPERLVRLTVPLPDDPAVNETEDAEMA